MFFIFSLFTLFLEKNFLHWTGIFHGTCLTLSPDSVYISFYQAIVCGKNLESGHNLEVFALSGLLHLLVVSGSHLLALFYLGRFLKIPDSILTGICFLYCFVCQLEAPIVRAYLFIFLTIFHQKYRLQWSAWHRHFLVILLCLIIHPLWWKSLSFQLSILCAFALSLPFERKEIWIYVILFPALMILGNYHPFSILVNIYLGPLLGMILFPLSALALFIPHFHLIVDPIWQILLFLLNHLKPLLLTLPSLRLHYSVEIFWLYILIILLIGFYKHYVSHRHSHHIHSSIS